MCLQLIPTHSELFAAAVVIAAKKKVIKSRILSSKDQITQLHAIFPNFVNYFTFIKESYECYLKKYKR